MRPSPTPSRPPSPVDPTLRRVLAFFSVITVVLVGVVTLAVRNIDRAEHSTDWVNHTHAILLESDALLASVASGDGALRTFVMTGDPRDQAAAREAFGTVSEHIELASALTRNEPAQHAEIDRLGEIATQRATLAQQVLEAWPGDRSAAVRLLLAGDAGVSTLNELRRLAAKLKAEEMALLAERDTASYLQAQRTRWSVWLGVALDGLLLGGVAWLIRDDLRARRRAAVALEEANAQLEAKVAARTAELSAANAALGAENLERRWSQQAAEHQLRYHQLIFNSIGELVVVVTKALHISRVNPAVLHAARCGPSALIDRPLTSLARLDHTGPESFDPLAQALREGRELRALPAVLTDSGGQTTRARLTLFPVRDHDKVVGGVVLLTTAAPESSAAR